MADKPIDITDDSFDEFISKNSVVVLDCWAAWCGPCRMLSPIVEELASQRDDVVFGKLNVDQNRRIPMKFGIMSIPTLLYFKDGRLVDRTLGVIPKEIIEARLEKLQS
jgi:thioredoxin 1